MTEEVTLDLDYTEDVEMADLDQDDSNDVDKSHFSEVFDTVENIDTAARSQKSVEGWIVLVTNVHEEATEEDVSDKFADFGDLLNLHLNLDRRSGFVKGYALIEFKTYEEAKEAIDKCDKTELLGSVMHCDFAFVKPSEAALKQSNEKDKTRRSDTRNDSRREDRRDNRRGDRGDRYENDRSRR